MPALTRGVKVRVLRPPPSRVLEGVDLGASPLQKGRVYELEPIVANVLLLWEYAVRVNRPKSQRRLQKKVSSPS